LFRNAGKFKQKIRKVEDWHDSRFKRTSKDARRIWTDMEKSHHDKKTNQKYYRLFFMHRVPRDSELWLKLKINILNSSSDNIKDSQFYVKRFRYRIDPFNKRMNRVQLHKRQFASRISKIAKDRVIKTAKPKKEDSDYNFKMVKVKKGIKLPYAIRDMYMGYSGGFTGAQMWIKFGKATLETLNSDTP